MNKKPENFNDYAAVYDTLYSEKNYEGECDMLEKIFSTYIKKTKLEILDIGCGTGNHAIPMAQRGHNVLGIDRSEEMLKLARNKAQKKEITGQLKFEQTDATDINLDKKFDAIICMFAVMSYQTRNSDMISLIQGARKQLNTGGIFVFDFWYGPAVLSQRPEERVKSIKSGDSRTIRIVKPEIKTEDNTVEVNYQILELKKDRLIRETNEKHSMRYIFKPEIAYLLNHHGFEIVHFCPFAELDKEVGENTWNAMVVARAKDNQEKK